MTLHFEVENVDFEPKTGSVPPFINNSAYELFRRLTKQFPDLISISSNPHEVQLSFDSDPSDTIVIHEGILVRGPRVILNDPDASVTIFRGTQINPFVPQIRFTFSQD